MSSPQSPYKLLGNFFKQARSVKMSEPYRIIDVAQDDGKMYCTVRWMGKNLEVSRIRRILYALEWINPVEGFGFTKEQLKKRHLCTEPDCYFVGRIYFMIHHLHQAHRIAVSEVGKVIESLEFDNRVIPENRYRRKMAWKRIKKNFLYFIRDGIDV